MMSENLLIIVSCAVLMEAGSVFKLMFDLMRDKHLKFRYILVRSVLSLMVGGWVGYLGVLWDYNPTKQATPFIVLTLIGFSLDALLERLQHNGHKLLLNRLFGKQLFDVPMPSPPPPDNKPVL